MSEYPATITKALHEIMQKVSYVRKGGENKFHNYKYAGESDLLEALRPAMLESGLLLLPSGVEQSSVDQYGNTHITIAYTLAHKDGDVWPDKLIAFGCGNDKNKQGGVGDKGLYKAITGANKYLLFKLFQIETGDDPERAEHDVPNIPPPDLTPASDQRMAESVGKVLNKKPAEDIQGLPRNEQEWKAQVAKFVTAINACNSVGAVDKLEEAATWIKHIPSEKTKAYVADVIQGRKDILETPTDNTIIGAS